MTHKQLRLFPKRTCADWLSLLILRESLGFSPRSPEPTRKAPNRPRHSNISVPALRAPQHPRFPLPVCVPTTLTSTDWSREVGLRARYAMFSSMVPSSFLSHLSKRPQSSRQSAPVSEDPRPCSAHAPRHSRLKDVGLLLKGNQRETYHFGEVSLRVLEGPSVPPLTGSSTIIWKPLWQNQLNV